LGIEAFDDRYGSRRALARNSVLQCDSVVTEGVVAITARQNRDILTALDKFGRVQTSNVPGTENEDSHDRLLWRLLRRVLAGW
jgi:hypothetical protein